MKTFKRTLSCFLALLMIFGSCSVLSYAALKDNDEISSQIYTKYYVDGVETSTVKAGDTVKARVYLATNYLLGTSEIFFVYPSNFLEFDADSLTIPVDTGYGGTQFNAANAFNKTTGSTAAAANLSGMVVQQVGFTPDSWSAADEMVFEGYFSEEFFADKGWVWLCIQGGTPTVFTPDAEYVADDWIAEFTFTVKGTATADDIGYLHVPESSVMNPTDRGYAKTWIQRANSSSDFGSDSNNAYEMDYNVDLSKDIYTIKLAASEGEFYAVSYSFAGDIPEGYDEKVPDSTEAKEGDIISAPEVEIPDGYELEWTATGATLNADGTYTVGAGAVAFLGTWKKKAATTYNVTYSYSNETPAGATAAPEAGTVEANGTIPAPVVTVPAGYELTWNVTGATKNDDGSYTAGAGDVEFVGTWAKIDYAVTYSFSNEGPDGVNAPAAGSTTVDATIAAPSTVAPAGWTLTWAVDGATKNDDGSYTAGAGDVEFVGTWAKVEYDVTYSFSNEAPNGITAPAAGKTTVDEVINPGITAPAGYTLTWAVTGATDNGNGTYTAGANNVSFVGTWNAIEYNVTYSFANEGPEGIDVPANGKTTVGAVINPGITAPAGWVFRWNVQGATSNGDGTFTAAANDVVFVGNWTKKNYNVTYSFANAGPEGVNAPVPGTTSVGDVITPAVDVPAGYVLTWAVTGATDNGDGSYTAGASDVTFVGTWAKNSYTITYYLTEQDYADGKVYDTQTIEVDDAVKLIDAEVPGSEFVSWTLQKESGEFLPETPAKMPAENLVAIADLIPYLVTFYDVYGEDSTITQYSGKAEITAEDLPSEEAAKAGEDVNFVEWRANGVKFETPYTVEGDVDVYAYCTVDIVFYADEEMTAVHKTLTFDFDHEITEEDLADLGKPTKKGHRFDDWDVDFLYTIADHNDYAAPIFTANDYTANFMVDGEVYDTKEVTFGNTIEAPADPEKEGYTFEGWTDVEGGKALDKLVMDAEGKTFYPVFVMNGSADFSIELYLMNTEGKYDATPTKVLTESGLVGVTAKADHDGCQQYVDDWFSADTSEEAGNVYEGVILEDDSLVLKLYYKRATVEITVNGETDDYYIGEVIPAPDVDETKIPDGYEQDGWVDENGDPVEVPYTVKEDGNPTEIKPNIVPSTDTAYTVEIYLMNEKGEYPAVASSSVSKTGTTDTMATADYADYAPAETYYSADETAEGTVTEAKITGDGKAVLKLYFKRATVEITVNGETDDYYIGEEIPAPVVDETKIPDGYEQDGWVDENGDPVEVPYTVKENGNPTEIKPNIVPSTDTAYTVEIYLMNEKGEYPAAASSSVSKTGTTDTMATADYADYAPAETYYSADETAEGTVTEAKITGDGKAVLKLYFKRAQYEVVIDGAKDSVFHGATITAPETVIVTPEGYHLASWNDGAVAMGQEIVVTGPVTLEPDFAPNTDTTYTVEIYLMNEKGEYSVDTSASKTGTTDTMATAAYADYAPAEAYYSADETAEGTVTEAKITGDGKAVLKLYFKRAQYDVTIDGVTTQVYHGATIKAPEATTQTAPAGYAFAGWNNGTIAAGATITVTEGITLEPYFAEGAATYTVEIYLMDAEGNYAAPETKTVTGTTGADVTIAHADYAQADYYLADDAQANVFSGTISGDGSLILKLYFKRATYDVIVDGNVVAEDVIHGAEVTLPEESDNITEGNELAGWTDGKNIYEPGETIVVEGALDLVPVEKPSDATKYTISIYIMDVDGNYVGTSTVAYGTTGATQTIVADNSREGFTVNAEKSNLTDTIDGDGTTVLSVYYDRNLYKATFDGVEYQVYYGASLPEVEPAAQTGKEFLAWTPEVPATMPAEDLVFTSTWADAVYNIIYVINGEEHPYPYAAGAAVTPIEDPSVAGMKFIGWNKEIPAVMPAEDVIIVAKFEAAVFNVTFLDGDGREFDKKAVQYGDTIVLPTTNPTKEYHVFKGWLDVPETMPAANITIYPDFERVPVRLVAAEGSTTDIDRSTMIITGLTTKMNDAKAAQYLAVEGDGYYTLTPAANYVGFYGTGAKVEVYDNADTSAPIEVFYIVIYGDVNGDSAVNSVDNSIVESEVLFSTNWSRGSEKDELRVMAADLNKDGKIKQGDADSILNSALGISTIDQATGDVTR